MVSEASLPWGIRNFVVQLLDSRLTKLLAAYVPNDGYTESLQETWSPPRLQQKEGGRWSRTRSTDVYLPSCRVSTEPALIRGWGDRIDNF